LLGLVGLGVTTALLFGIGHAYLKSHRWRNNPYRLRCVDCL
jgi:hypothetical protein